MGEQVSSKTPSALRYQLVTVLGILVVFLLFGASVHYLVNPELLYHPDCPTSPDRMVFFDAPIFLTDMAYFSNFLGFPGGIIEYAGGFLSQFTCYRTRGTLVLTGMAFLICIAGLGMMRAVAGDRVPLWVCLIPVVIISAIIGMYRFQMVTLAALLVILIGTNAYVWLPLRGAAARCVVFVLLGVLLYYVVGPPVLLYGVLCGVHELVSPNRISILGRFHLVAVVLVFLGGSLYLRHNPHIDVFTRMCNRHDFIFQLRMLGSKVPSVWQAWWTVPFMLHACLALFFPVACLALGARRMYRGKSSLPKDLGMFAMVVLLFVGMLVGYLTHDEWTRKRLEVDYYAQQQNWPMVLVTAKGMPEDLYDVYVHHEVYVALYYTGQLLDNMFCYPAISKLPGIMITEDFSSATAMRKLSEGLLRLGAVNMAQQQAHQALESGGYTPQILKLLVKIYTLKDRTPVVRQYLAMMKRDFIMSEWAGDYLRRMDADPALTGDKELGPIRKLMPTKDYGYGGYLGFFTSDPYERILREILSASKGNRMAFEYLSAHYLLGNQREKLWKNRGKLEELDYNRIPRLYEQALQAHTWPKKLKVSPGAVKAFAAMAGSLEEYRKAATALVEPTVEAARRAAEAIGPDPGDETKRVLGRAVAAARDIAGSPGGGHMVESVENAVRAARSVADRAARLAVDSDKARSAAEASAQAALKVSKGAEKTRLILAELAEKWGNTYFFYAQFNGNVPWKGWERRSPSLKGIPARPGTAVSMKKEDRSPTRQSHYGDGTQKGASG